MQPKRLDAIATICSLVNGYILKPWKDPVDLAVSTVRLPADTKAFIEAEARENASSQNSEIVRAIRERMKRKGAAETAISPRPDVDHPNQRTVEHAER